MKRLISTGWCKKSNIKFAVAPVLLIICNLFVFGPATIYSGNIAEFNISLIDILKYYAIPGMIMLLIFLGIATLLSKRYLSVYVSLIFAAGVLLWLQGNIFVWDYGVFGKGNVDWTKDSWRGWVDGSLWLVLLTLACVFYKRVSRVATLTCTVLILLQMIMLIYTGIQRPEIWKKVHKTAIAPPKEIFEFSTKQNVIHVILDEFQSTLFRGIIDGDPEYYKTALEGFTFFEETTGSFPTTYMSLPALFSGQIYRNDVPIREFIHRVFKGETISNVLYDNGYEVDFATSVGFSHLGRYSNYYSIPVPYGVTKQQYERANAALMLDLVSFRYSPHFLKKSLYNNQLHLPVINLRKKDVTYKDGARHFAHKAFLQDLIDNMAAKRSKPVYKFMHLTTTHFPAVLNKDCEYAGKILPWRWENIKIQVKCSFDHFLGFLNRLKSLGIYESSFIILQADHGYYKVPESKNEIDLKEGGKEVDTECTKNEEYFAKIICSSLPLLAIKPPYSKGPLRTSKAQAMLTDIPITISSVLNIDTRFKGQSVFEIDSNKIRQRPYLYYDRMNRPGDKYYDRINEYVVEGSALDTTSWRFVSAHPSMEYSFQVKDIDFGTKESSKFLLSGWSFKEMEPVKGLTYNWAVGNSASLLISLPKDKVVVLTANVKTPKFSEPQHVTIKVDGKLVGSWANFIPWKWKEYSVVIETDDHRPDVSVVKFNFSQYKCSKRDPRQLAVLFESIKLSEFEAEK